MRVEPEHRELVFRMLKMMGPYPDETTYRSPRAYRWACFRRAIPVRWCKANLYPAATDADIDQLLRNFFNHPFEGS